MKKLLALLMAVLMVLSLSACSNKPAETETANTPDTVEVPAISVVESTVASTTRDGVQIPAYVTLPASLEGVDSLVVLIHGHHGNHNEWGGYDTVSNTLAENGIVAVTLDFAGCGASNEDYTNNAMSYMCADVKDVVESVKAGYGLTKVGAMGYSMGGRIISQILIEDMLHLDSIVFVAPATSLADMVEMFNGQEYYDNMKAEVEKTGEMFPFPGAFGEQLLSATFFNDLEKYGEDMAELAAAKYEGNSLTIYSTDDYIVSPSVSAKTAEAFGSQVVTVSNGGHSYSFYSEDQVVRNSLNAAISTFFIEDLK